MDGGAELIVQMSNRHFLTATENPKLIAVDLASTNGPDTREVCDKLVNLKRDDFALISECLESVSRTSLTSRMGRIIEVLPLCDDAQH